MRIIRRVVLASCITFLMTFTILELGLRLFDPWGARRYFADQAFLYSRFTSDPQRGYYALPGMYQFSNWQADILPDTSRRVPDSAISGCKVVFVGDSITFGWGVNDAQTWINLVARHVPTAQLINAGTFSYNAERVRASLAAFPDAAVYIYFAVDNDGDPDPNWQGTYSSQLILEDYAYAALAPYRLSAPMPGFAAALADLKRRTTVLAINANGWANRIGAFPIPPYTHHISRTDGHADATGNQEIAAAVTPLVQQAVARACPTI